MIREGATFDGYHLVRLLGRGGAGEVYLADPPARGLIQEQVALKIYRAARDEPFALEVMRQAQLVAALRHPQILPCYTEAAQGDDLAIVMAYASGGSLGDALNTRRPSMTLPLRPALVARIVRQVARALADVHARGLIHGDLKPSNLFVRTDSEGSSIVALSDFGHAMLTSTAVWELQRNRFGQPPVWVNNQLTWAAPEQLQGKVLPASDQYGLAALAYFLLTGVPPVSAEAQALISGNAPRPIVPPSRLNPALDDEVDAALFNALAPVPFHRFNDVASFAEALDEALAANNAGGSYTDYPSPASSSKIARSSTRNPAKRTLAHMSMTRSHKAASNRAASKEDASNAIVLDTADFGDWDDAPPAKRRLSPLTTLALLLTVFACVMSVLVLNPGGMLPVRLDLAGLAGAQSTPTAISSPTPAKTAAQLQAESRLRAALASKPVYSDALTGTPAAWLTDGKSAFFGADHRLHLRNTAKGPLVDDMPADASIPKGAYVTTVDVALLTGSATTYAGLRFLVSTSAKGDTYYSYQVNSNGRFELWAQQLGTGLTFLTGGFVPSLKAGTGATNTLAVLVDPKASTLTLYANGTFVFEAPIPSGVAMTGRAGVIAADSGVEAAFTNFAIHGA